MSLGVSKEKEKPEKEKKTNSIVILRRATCPSDCDPDLSAVEGYSSQGDKAHIKSPRGGYITADISELRNQVIVYCYRRGSHLRELPGVCITPLLQ